MQRVGSASLEGSSRVPICPCPAAPCPHHAAQDSALWMLARMGGLPWASAVPSWRIGGVGRVKPFLLTTAVRSDSVLELLLWKPGLAPRLCLWVTGQVFSRAPWTMAKTGWSWFTAAARLTARGPYAYYLTLKCMRCLSDPVAYAVGSPSSCNSTFVPGQMSNHWSWWVWWWQRQEISYSAMMLKSLPSCASVSPQFSKVFPALVSSGPSNTCLAHKLVLS